MAAAEKNELLKEIAFLSNLIHSHKQQSNHIQSSSATNSNSKIWIRNTSSRVNQPPRRVVKPLSSVSRPSDIRLPVHQAAVRSAVSPTRKVLACKNPGAIINRDGNVIGKVNNTVLQDDVCVGSRTTALSNQVASLPRSVLIKNPGERPALCNHMSQRVRRSSLPNGNELKKTAASAVPVPQLRVTVTSCTTNSFRAVTTVAPTTSRVAGSNRTVLMGLQSKVVPVGVPKTDSGASISCQRIVCSPQAKSVGRVVIKPTAYKWAAKPKLSPVRTNVLKTDVPMLVAPHKLTKLNLPPATTSPTFRKSNFLSVIAPHKLTKLNPTVSTSTAHKNRSFQASMTYKKPAFPVATSSLKSTKLESPYAPLMTSTPQNLRGMSFMRTPTRDKLTKKIVKTKYSLVRTPSVKTERKIVRNLYTWFNARPSPISTPRLKRKVGKYSLLYVKSNRASKKCQLLPASSYRYNSHKSPRSRSLRHSRSRFGTSSLSVSRRCNRITQKYKFFKRNDAPNSPKATLEKNLSTKLVMIGGILYKSSKNKLAKTTRRSPVVKVSRLDAKKVKIITVRGVKFKMDSSGKTLQRLHQSSDCLGQVSSNFSGTAARLNASFSRVDLGGVTFVETRPGVLVKSQAAQKRTFASQVVNRSIHRLVAANKKSSQYCMFFNRFGKCHKKESGNCPYRHDPEKVAVCTRFLQGGCSVENCPFSHKVCRTKMPACSFFLEGRCSSDDCPYLHVNVNPKAEVCKDFLKGYCSLGEKCKKRHTYVCPEFQNTGKCEKGKKCFLKHAAKPKWKKPAVVAPSIPVDCNNPEERLATCKANSLATHIPHATSVPMKRKLEEIDEDDKNLPFKQRRLPSFIRLGDDSDDEPETVDNCDQAEICPGATSPLGSKPSV